MHNLLSKLILILTVMGLFSFNAHSQDKPDFDYPQQVSKDALAQLKKAQKSGDGQMMVDALVRFSIAKGKVSQESMDTIITQIEDVKKKEKRADFKAILNYLEACVFMDYLDAYGVHDRENAADEAPASDYTEWDNEQFNNKIKELLRAALADEQTLKQCPIGNYSKLFIDGDAMGAVYVPTLFQAICFNSIKLFEYRDEKFVEELKQRWLQSCQEGTPEWMFVAVKTDAVKDDFAEYLKYKDNEHSAIFLLNSYARDHYSDLKEYVNRFPNSYYTPEVQNKIYSIESQSVNLNYDKHLSNSDPFKVRASFSNVNDVEVRIYRVPDNVYEALENSSSKKFTLESLEFVRSHKLHSPGVVPFSNDVKEELPPLPFGRYLIVGAFTNREGKEIVDVDIRSNEVIVVHNLTMFAAGGEGFDDKVFTVDTRSGKPQQGVKLDIVSRYSNKNDKSSATTDKDGSAVLPNDKKYYNHIVTATLGDDKYSPKIGVQPFISSEHDSNVTARVFTDLNIYRPGETMKFAAILHIITSEQMSPLENKKVRVILYDTNHKAVDTVEVESDAYGRIQGEFKIPTDRMNGRFSLDFRTGEKYGDYLASHSINVSEYKAPTFTVSFPDTRQVFTCNQPVKITGKAQTYSGVPVPGAEVKLRLYRNEWSWWWRWSTTRGENVIDTVMTTNENGEFTLELPASSFKENEAKYWHYNYVLDAVHQRCRRVARGQSLLHHWRPTGHRAA